MAVLISCICCSLQNALPHRRQAELQKWMNDNPKLVKDNMRVALRPPPVVQRSQLVHDQKELPGTASQTLDLDKTIKSFRKGLGLRTPPGKGRASQIAVGKRETALSSPQSLLRSGQPSAGVDATSTPMATDRPHTAPAGVRETDREQAMATTYALWRPQGVPQDPRLGALVHVVNVPPNGSMLTKSGVLSVGGGPGDDPDKPWRPQGSREIADSENGQDVLHQPPPPGQDGGPAQLSADVQGHRSACDTSQDAADVDRAARDLLSGSAVQEQGDARKNAEKDKGERKEEEEDLADRAVAVASPPSEPTAGSSKAKKRKLLLSVSCPQQDRPATDRVPISSSDTSKASALPSAAEAPLAHPVGSEDGSKKPAVVHRKRRLVPAGQVVSTEPASALASVGNTVQPADPRSVVSDAGAGNGHLRAPDATATPVSNGTASAALPVKTPKTSRRIVRRPSEGPVGTNETQQPSQKGQDLQDAGRKRDAGTALGYAEDAWPEVPPQPSDLGTVAEIASASRAAAEDARPAKRVKVQTAEPGGQPSSAVGARASGVDVQPANILPPGASDGSTLPSSGEIARPVNASEPGGTPANAQGASGKSARPARTVKLVKPSPASEAGEDAAHQAVVPGAKRAPASSPEPADEMSRPSKRPKLGQDDAPQATATGGGEVTLEQPVEPLEARDDSPPELADHRIVPAEEEGMPLEHGDNHAVLGASLSDWIEGYLPPPLPEEPSPPLPKELPPEEVAPLR